MVEREGEFKEGEFNLREYDQATPVSPLPTVKTIEKKGKEKLADTSKFLYIDN